MPQLQKIVSLILKGRPTTQAVATGNNAAWICPCGRTLPLIGRSDNRKGGRVICPDCNRKYQVVPEAGPLTKVLQIIEIE